MPDKDLIARINETVAKATDKFNLVTSTSRIIERIPYVGPHIVASGMKQSLAILKKAFERGYIPGDIEVPRWSDASLVSAIDHIYWPENRAHLEAETKEILARYARHTREESSGFSKVRDGEYEIIISDEAAMDLIAPIVPIHPLRKLEFCNRDKSYWLNWATELKDHVVPGVPLGIYTTAQLTNTYRFEEGWQDKEQSL